MSIPIAPNTRLKAPVTLNAGDSEISLGFPLDAAEHVTVYRRRAGVDLALSLNTHYSVTDLNTVPGAKIVLSPVAEQDDEYWVVGSIAPERALVFANGGKYNPDQHNLSFEQAVIADQEARRDIDLALRQDYRQEAFQAKGKRINGLADAVDDTDAVNKSQVDAIAGSASAAAASAAAAASSVVAAAASAALALAAQTATEEALAARTNLYSFGGVYEPTINHLNHGTGSGDTQGLSSRNALVVVRGTSSTPDTVAKYANTAAYIELHTAVAEIEDISVWGNPRKIPALTVEAIAHTGFEGELNGGAFRAYSTDEPGNLSTGMRNLVGVSAVASTNTGSGNESYSPFAANFVASHLSGLAPDNLIGIEVDLVHNVGPATGQTVPGTGNNYTAYWAQSDANGVTSTAAFLITKTARSLGWNFGLYASTNFQHWGMLLTNTWANALGKGIRIEISSTAVSSRIMGLYANGAEQMRVTGEAANPVSIKVNASLRNVREKNFENLTTGDKVLIGV